MDKLLRPKKFDCDPNSILASRNWTHWFRTFNNFLEAVEASEKQKLNLLFRHISPAIYEYISECQTYKRAVSVLNSLYTNTPCEVLARYNLLNRKQLEGESISQYIQILRQLSRDCKFRAPTAEGYRDDYIRDAFVSGLLSPIIRHSLLETSFLSLENALDQALSIEAAHHHTETYDKGGLSGKTAIQYSKGEHFELQDIQHPETLVSKCFFYCSGTYSGNKCPARNSDCLKCDKNGHFMMLCNSNSGSKTNMSASILASEHFTLSKASIKIRINNYQTEALIDMGSTASFISDDFVLKYNLKIYPEQGKFTIASTSIATNILGYCVTNVYFLENSYKGVKFMVLQGLCSDVILGHDFIKQHESIMISFGGSKNSIPTCSDALAQVPPASLFENLTNECRPIAIKSRRHSKDEQEFIQGEVKRLLDEGIIEPSRSPWCAQVLVTSGVNHKNRLVIDYSQTINRFTLLDDNPLPRIDHLIHKMSQNQVFSIVDLQNAHQQIPILLQDKQYTAFEAVGHRYQFCRIPFGVTNGVAAFQKVMHYIIENERMLDTFAHLDLVTICGSNKEEHDKNLENFFKACKKYNLSLNYDKCNFCQQKINVLGYIIEKKSIRPDPSRFQSITDIPSPTNATSLRQTVGLLSYYGKWIFKFSEKIRPLIQNIIFPLPTEVENAFQGLKEDIIKAMVTSIDDKAMFTVEMDASGCATAITLSQADRPVAFFSRTKSVHSSIEIQVCALVEAFRCWRHYLVGRRFKLVTDQKSASLMPDIKHCTKIKNEKFLQWRLELSCYNYDIIYCLSKENFVADNFSQIGDLGTVNTTEISHLHDSLCHPGVTRFYHWVRSKNLPYLLEDIRKITSDCQICSDVKPRFYQIIRKSIKANSVFERLNLDYKGPLPSTSKSRYILTVVDEFSRFPFAFPCHNITASTVISCLQQLFSMFGMPSLVHFDGGTSFMSAKLKNFLLTRGIAISRSIPYNPPGNGHEERSNDIIWKTIALALRSKNKEYSEWQKVLPEALHSIRSLLCTDINCTPHERMFRHPRRSSNGVSVPTWLSIPGTVLMRKQVRRGKFEPMDEEVELLEANTQCAYIRTSKGEEAIVSVHNLAPCPEHSPIFYNSQEGSTNEQNHREEEQLPRTRSNVKGISTLPINRHSVEITTPGLNTQMEYTSPTGVSTFPLSSATSNEGHRTTPFKPPRRSFQVHRPAPHLQD